MPDGRIDNTKPHHWATQRKLRGSLKLVRHTIPVEWIAFLTFTFVPGTTDREASDEFGAISRQLQQLFPGGWVRLIAFSKKDAIHIHAIVIVNQNIQKGWNDANYLAMRALNKLPRPLSPEQKKRRDHLARNLTSNVKLKSLWKKLKALVTRRRSRNGLKPVLAPRFELTPVRATMERLAEYFDKNFKNTASRAVVEGDLDMDSAADGGDQDGTDLALTGQDLPAVLEEFMEEGRDAFSRLVSHADEIEPLGSIHPQPKQIRPQLPGTLTKGTRIIAYGGEFPGTLVVEKGPGWIRFQEKLGVITRALETPKEYLTHRFGPRWCFHLRRLVLDPLEATYGRNIQDWSLLEARRLALTNLAEFDRWTQCGWPAEAIRYAVEYYGGLAT